MIWKMEKIKKLFFTILGFVIVNSGFAQDAEMADTMRSNGKIYVVVGIILIILFGLIAYLLLLDRKITRLEKEMDKLG